MHPNYHPVNCMSDSGQGLQMETHDFLYSRSGRPVVDLIAQGPEEMEDVMNMGLEDRVKVCKPVDPVALY